LPVPLSPVISTHTRISARRITVTTFMDDLVSTHRSGAAWTTARRALLAMLVALPAGRLPAQAATDSQVPRPKALGTVVISATRTEQELRSLPAHVVVVGRPAIVTSAAPTVPDLLRQIPASPRATTKPASS
jgi:outer membrane receptor protein involved in Fe transport